MPALTVHNAEIKTAAVEVKTLTISGKQVTLAVFRQLQEVPLIAEDGTFAGVPWGTVNYHPDKCGDDDGHWHVVWQRGSDLFRSFVRRQIVPQTFRPTGGTEFIDAHVRDVLSGAGSRFWNGAIPQHADSDLVTDTIAGVGLAYRVGNAARAALVRRLELERTLEQADRGGKVWFYEAHRSITSSAALHARRFLLDESLKEIKGDAERSYAEVQSVAKAEAARRQRHVDARKAIADLPQLFIAV